MTLDDELKAAAAYHETMWRMYGEQSSYQTWQHALHHINQRLSIPEICAPIPNTPQKKKKKHRPGCTRVGWSAETRAKLSGPKTEAQKAAMRVPKRDSSKMAQWPRSAEWCKNAANRARARVRLPEERTKISEALSGPKNYNYKTIVFSAVHPIHGMFFGDRLQLHKMHPGLSLSGLRKLALGEHRTYKGWIVVQKARY